VRLHAKVIVAHIRRIRRDPDRDPLPFLPPARPTGPHRTGAVGTETWPRAIDGRPGSAWIDEDGQDVRSQIVVRGLPGVRGDDLDDPEISVPLLGAAGRPFQP